MARSMQHFTHSVCLNVTVIALLFVSVNSDTLLSDILILRAFKQSVDPASISASSFLNTWNFDIDPCESIGNHFLGILCTTPSDNSSTQVTMLDLEGDALEGFLTPAVGNLTELTVLNLSKNKFRGPVPTTIPNLTKLTTLLLSDNYFSGSLPNRIGQLTRLQTLDISRNRLSGPLPPTIYSFRSLTRLSLSNNEFSGRLPDLSMLWQVITLDLSNNQFYGNLPKLPHNVRTLLLSHNIFSGHISGIKKLQHLRTIDLSDNRLTGSIDQQILELPMLVHLNLSQNRFTSMPVMPYAGFDTLLKVIDVQGNRLHGHLPVNLVTFENLTFVDLSHNLYSGRVPREFGDRLGSPWRSLFLDHNFLSGSLPLQFNNNAARVKGSAAQNCLSSCPLTLRFCRGGQRRATECVGRKDGGI